MTLNHHSAHVERLDIGQKNHESTKRPAVKRERGFNRPGRNTKKRKLYFVSSRFRGFVMSVLTIWNPGCSPPDSGEIHPEVS